jgi:TatD DNase family protein
MSIQLFDSHCHFDFPVFDSSRKKQWSECNEQGVSQLLIPGVEPKQWSVARDISMTHQGIVMAAGLHPWWISSAELPLVEEWQNALSYSSCVAIGECGLDACIDVPMRQQVVIFERHLQLAMDYDMPLIIHVRQAHNELVRLLKRYRPAKAGVIHGFSGSLELAKTYWKMGFRLGIGGVITYPRAKKTRAVVAGMPLSSLLLETDAPDMPLQGFQGEENHPLRLLDVANTVATLRGEPLADIAAATTENTLRLFAI